MKAEADLEEGWEEKQNTFVKSYEDTNDPVSTATDYLIHYSYLWNKVLVMCPKSTFSLSRRDKEEIESLVKAGHYTSNSDVIKTAFRMLKERHPEYRTDIAVEMFKDGKASIGRAAEIAGMSRESFKEILEERGVKREIEPREGSEERIERTG